MTLYNIYFAWGFWPLDSTVNFSHVILLHLLAFHKKTNNICSGGVISYGFIAINGASFDLLLISKIVN